MSLSKQAKTLTKSQIDALLIHVGNGRHAIRNRLIVLVSVRAGLRAKEIAHVTWSRVLNSDGSIADDIALTNAASKGSSGRRVPMAKDLKRALMDWRSEVGITDQGARVITTERSQSTSAQAVGNMFVSWYAALGFSGCSSHSGRRAFITVAARRISTVGGSLRDVQSLAGHSSLTTTQRYIEVNAEAKQTVVELV